MGGWASTFSSVRPKGSHLKQYGTRDREDAQVRSECFQTLETSCLFVQQQLTPQFIVYDFRHQDSTALAEVLDEPLLGRPALAMKSLYM